MNLIELLHSIYGILLNTGNQSAEDKACKVRELLTEAGVIFEIQLAILSCINWEDRCFQGLLDGPIKYKVLIK